MKAYLLAAGKGLRAGGPKAWLVHAGKTLLERQIAFLRGRFPSEGIAASIQEAWLLRCLRIDAALRWLPVDPAGTPLACLQSLIKALPIKDWGLVYHVDMPVWEPGLFDLLRSRLRQEPGGASAKSGIEALIPAYQGKRGHPVFLSAKLQAKLLALDPGRDRLDHWLRSQRAQTIETGFPCVVENWNSGPRPSAPPSRIEAGP